VLCVRRGARRRMQSRARILGRGERAGGRGGPRVTLGTSCCWPRGLEARPSRHLRRHPPDPPLPLPLALLLAVLAVVAVPAAVPAAVAAGSQGAAGSGGTASAGGSAPTAPQKGFRQLDYIGNIIPGNRRRQMQAQQGPQGSLPAPQPVTPPPPDLPLPPPHHCALQLPQQYPLPRQYPQQCPRN